MTNNRSRLRGADNRLLRGYAPLAGLSALFLVMVLLAPTVAPEQLVGTALANRSRSPAEHRAARSTAGGAAAPGATGAPTGPAGTGRGDRRDPARRRVPGLPGARRPVLAALRDMGRWRQRGRHVPAASPPTASPSPSATPACPTSAR